MTLSLTDPFTGTPFAYDPGPLPQPGFSHPPTGLGHHLAGSGKVSGRRNCPTVPAPLERRAFLPRDQDRPADGTPTLQNPRYGAKGIFPASNWLQSHPRPDAPDPPPQRRTLGTAQ